MSGGAGGGANVGVSGYAGYIPDDRNRISGDTMNTNVSTAVLSGTYMKEANTGGFNGVLFGSAARLGASETFAKTSIYGLRDLFDSLFGWWGSRGQPKGSCP